MNFVQLHQKKAGFDLGSPTEKTVGFAFGAVPSIEKATSAFGANPSSETGFTFGASLSIEKAAGFGFELQLVLHLVKLHHQPEVGCVNDYD